LALINANSFKKVPKERNIIHKDVDATYTIFKDENGKKYFQIDTYGSKDRKIIGKISQSIQFDIESAKILVTLLNKEFNF
jgi:hypothetical protein